MPPPARRALCDLLCDQPVTQRNRQRCCGKSVCDACVTNMLRADYQRQRWHVLCPFCRCPAAVTTKRVKRLLVEHCPDHAKVVESELGPMAVIHAPGPEGRYDQTSTLQMLPSTMPDMMDNVLDRTEELTEELAEMRASHGALQQENERLRRSLRDQRGAPRPIAECSERPTFVGDLLALALPNAG